MGCEDSMSRDYVFDGLGLVFGFVEFEGVFEFAEPFVAGRKGVSDGGFALGVELEQFVGHVFHGLADAGLWSWTRLRCRDDSRAGLAPSEERYFCTRSRRVSGT